MAEPHRFIQPDWGHVQAAFIEGCREARNNPEATDHHFKRGADAYCKMIFEQVDPESERRLRENDWPELESHNEQ